MAVEMKIPDLAESITEVMISQWLKQDGDYVELDEMICEVETDKAAQELAAEAAGILRIVVPEGETVQVGDVICHIEAGENGASASTTANATAAANASSGGSATATVATPVADAKEIEMRVPELAESITEVMIGAWLKEEGDFVNMDETICEVETDKASQDLAAEASGILHIIAQEGDTLNVGELICTIKPAEAPAGNQANSSDPTTNTSAVASTGSAVSSTAAGHPSPAAAKILAEKGINPGDVNGTGVGGRITKEDALKAQKAAPAPAKKETPATVNTPAPVPGSRNQSRKRMSPLRKTVARRLVSVKNETAMLTTFNEANMQPIKDFRAKYKEQFKEKYGVSLGFMGFFAKACSTALLEIPGVNAQIDGNEIVYNEFVDISVAVSAPKGLVVPVLRNVETMGFHEVEQGIKNLAIKARDNKLSIEEMQGGTFTITNGGVFGSMMSTPIINAPQSAILGMHNIVDRPMAVNGEVKILPMMYLALSYDHRIIDGREAVTFLVRVKQLLEEPERLLFGV